VMADHSHHGEGEHDERAMPGTGLVVIEAELVLGGLKAVLNSPAILPPTPAFRWAYPLGTK